MILLIMSKLLKKIKPKVKLALLFLYIYINTNTIELNNPKFMIFIMAFTPIQVSMANSSNDYTLGLFNIFPDLFQI